MSRSTKASIAFISVILTISLFIPEALSQRQNQNRTQPEIEVRAKKTIAIEGKTFKDLNANGELDPYENWQLPAEERAADLVSKMTLAEKAGILQIFEFPEIKNGKIVLPNKNLNQNMRYFIFRETPNADVIANYNNQLQEAAESSRLGIPAIIISNPRNHADSILALSPEGPTRQGQFSFWPNTLGLAATRDLKLIEDFAEISSKEFGASGIRKLYGYSADVATDPLWARIEETFGEDPKLISDYIYRIVKGYQGDVLNPDSVTTTVRHYPGGGARFKGTDPHFESGRFNIYPTEGSLLKYHIPPFRAAIEADTTSIMPYYAYPSNDSANQGFPPFSPDQQFEEVGFAYNEIFLRYLRDELGFLGYVNSDTSAIIDKAWGVSDLSIEQRYAKALNAGTNVFSGTDNPTPIINAVNQGLVKEEVINRSVRYLITEMMVLGLFENPYVDPQNALTVVNDRASRERANDAHHKSVVLLRNDNLLPLTDQKIKDIKLYVEVFPGGEKGVNTQNLKEMIRRNDPAITMTDNLEDATHAFVWVLPKIDLFGGGDITLAIGPATGIDNNNRIIEIQKRVPTITAIDFKNPWLINGIEPNATSVIATFGVKPQALMDVIRGRFKPVGKLPFSIPATQQAVDSKAGDIPGFEADQSYFYTDKNGSNYGYGFGLTY